MKKIIFIGISLIIYSTLYSQTTQDWAKVYEGRGVCYSIAQTNDSNFVVVGRTYSETNQIYNCTIVKLNSSGNEIWRKSINSTAYDEARKVIVNSNGELIIAGNRNYYPLLLKTNSLGDTLWTRQIVVNDTMIGQIRDMQPISDSGYVLAGIYGDSFNLDENKVWLIRTNNEGNLIWSKLFTNGYANAITIINQNDIVIVGGNQLLKINSAGDVLWDTTITGNYYYEFYSVKETNDKGFILVGSSSSSGYKDLCIVKTDKDGNKIWEKIYGTDWEEVGKDVIQTADGSYLILGRAQNSNAGGPMRLWLMKANADGDTIWTRKFSVSNDYFSYVYPEAFIQNDDNKIIVAGNSDLSGTINWFASKYTLSLSGIENYTNPISSEFTLFQNYPNPFNPSTKIKFNIPISSKVKLSIFDVTGKLITQLLNKYLAQGLYEIDYDAFSLSSGIYFYQIEYSNYSQSRKMLLLK